MKTEPKYGAIPPSGGHTIEVGETALDYRIRSGLGITKKEFEVIANEADIISLKDSVTKNWKNIDQCDALIKAAGHSRRAG